LPRGSAISALFFLLGLGVFTYLVASFGVASIISHIAEGGWSLLSVILIWLVIYGLNAMAWRLALGTGGDGIGAGELFMVTVSGFAINYITPVVALGGEPYRVGVLSRRMGTQKAISAVVLYRMVHLLGHMGLLLAGIGVAFAFVPMRPAIAAGLGIAGAVIGFLIFLTLDGTRRGVFDRIGRILSKVRFPGFLSRPLDRYRGELAEMDRVLTHVYRNDRRSFIASVALEFLSRVLMGFEVFVILRVLGSGVTLPGALYIYVMYSIAINLFFFVPMNVGAREGGILIGMEGMAGDPVTGLSVAVVLRIREFFWIAVGLLFMLISPRLKGETGAHPTLTSG
jgi:uncharacterized protein (TIRG00374 family)